ncbi:hypothetical protein [Paludisphaera rhizosphaerae]|uniref:hypothetical protein n=1 Tax=Paludisphaera rhizosphaerae TaxID=2711216 RepID=UPI0013EE172E|nr:hypothetical protein [Paludisphaera rhizosphaerae]
MAGMVDIAIPLVIGLFMALQPQAFYKSTSPEEDVARTRKFRNIGFLLIGVAGLYCVAKFLTGLAA